MKVLIITPLRRQNPAALSAAVVSKRTRTKVDMMPCMSHEPSNVDMNIHKTHVALKANKNMLSGSIAAVWW